MSSQTPITPPISPSPVGPPPPVATAVAPARRSGVWLNVLIGIAALVAVGGVAFAIGRSTAPAATPQFGGFAGGGGAVVPDGSFDPGTLPGLQDGGGGAGGPGLGGGFAGLGGGLSIGGTVTAVDADSITIALADGEEMTIALDGETTYHASTDAAASDVSVGDDVSIGVGGIGRGPGAGAGSGGDDPSLTATDVTVSR